MVNLIIPEQNMRESEPVRFIADDLVAGRKSPACIDAICIGEDGWPTHMVVSDSRNFSVHKYWLSTLPDREPVKKPRDAGQAEIVRKITLEYFPHLPFDGVSMQHLPQSIRNLKHILTTPMENKTTITQ